MMLDELLKSVREECADYDAAKNIQGMAYEAADEVLNVARAKGISVDTAAVLVGISLLMEIEDNLDSIDWRTRFMFEGRKDNEL